MSNLRRTEGKRENSDVHLSKTLSWLLRHAAIKEGLKIKSDGYINVGEVLNNRHLKNKYSVEDIERVVLNNDKQRFSLRTDNEGSLQICVNQGHTITGKRENSDVHLSKTLSWLLRHAAIKEGLKIKSDGYINVGEVLNNRHLKNKYSVEDIERVVLNNDKRRFSLRTDNEGSLQICANQGRTITGKRENSDVHLSKTLSWLLRHAAIKEGLKIKSDGYINVGEVLNNRHLKNKYSVEDIERVVLNNDKRRFSLRTDNEGSLQICANQGHTITFVQNPNLIKITGDQFPVVIHGTFFKNWLKIKTDGINRMRRNHVHFSIGLPGDEKVISGVRVNTEVFIFVDVKSAILDGLVFYKSANDVILSPGNSCGIIESKYFLKVINRAGKSLL